MSGRIHDDREITPVACPDGKVPYPSRQTARRAARRAMAHYGESDLRAYRCPRCESWHVGHNEPRATREARRTGSWQ